ncbi:uncharacterized protein LOC111089907 [Limulus polyphemus]|uniref:Uncharacterized protein LOC111089907 n=1 Tax=Limulus polyphemus TaxID=6850 RepID=A0ABM1TSL2_LIMPO|nr:uncharacterized protein LOC111089907 [Limulus polyphemus]
MMIVFRRVSYPFQSRARHFTMSKNAKQGRKSRRLPPLSSITQSSLTPVQSSRIPSPVTKVVGIAAYPTGSRYHRNCRSTYRRESPGPGCYLDEILKTRTNPVSTQRRSSRFSGSNKLLSNTPTKMIRSCSHDNLSSKGLNPEKVTNYLRENIDFLEEYVVNNVDLELLERWMIRGVQKSRNRSQSVDVNGRTERKTSLSRWKV